MSSSRGNRGLARYNSSTALMVSWMWVVLLMLRTQENKSQWSDVDGLVVFVSVSVFLFSVGGSALNLSLLNRWCLNHGSKISFLLLAMSAKCVFSDVNISWCIVWIPWLTTCSWASNIQIIFSIERMMDTNVWLLLTSLVISTNGPNVYNNVNQDPLLGCQARHRK